MNQRSDIMKSINKNLQDYFIKLAPDFSTFDMVEKYYYDNNLTVKGIFKDVFYFNYCDNNVPFVPLLSVSTTFFRGMFLIYSTGDFTVNANPDEYTVFPYRDAHILISIQDNPIIITSEIGKTLELVIGVAF
jgi:hypothetical protein